MRPPAAVKPPLAVRVARTALLTLTLAAALLWAIPRVVPRVVGDRLFLREEFFHPTSYRAGGLTIGGFTIGGKTVDCSRLERPRVSPGRNALANPGLDGPCGWGFVPHLGDKTTKHAGGADGCFRIRGTEASIFQDLLLGEIGTPIDRGEVTLLFTGRFQATRGIMPQFAAEAYAGDANPWETTGRFAHAPPVRGSGWQSASAAWEVPRGSRRIRILLRGSGGSGTLLFDELSVVFSRSITVPSLPAGTGPVAPESRD